MNLPFFIARRYLFSPKSHSAINIISAISAIGIAISTVALVCVISVFNGFRDLVGGLYSNFDPQIEIAPRNAKHVDANLPTLRAVRGVKGVACVAECYEENALILYKGNPLVVTVRGIDSAYVRVSSLDQITHNADQQSTPLPPLSTAGIDYAVPGAGLASRMGVNFGKIQICAPRPGERINMANPAESFSLQDIFSCNTYFQVNQKRYDDNLLLTSLSFAQRLFEQPGHITSLALTLSPEADESEVKAELQRTLGPNFTVSDRTEQHADTFRVMAIEKLMAYIFLTFIALVACFNLISSVAMLIIEKRRNAATLTSLGMNLRDVSRIFIHESRLLTFFGATAGLLIGLLLCYLQETYGLIGLGGEGNFIINSYPVSIHILDIAIVYATVLLVGFAAVWYPVRSLSRRLLG